MSNSYFQKCVYLKKEIINYITTIFRVYDDELVLKLEDYNLLKNRYNCLESSTAPGFIIEEFIVSKLEKYSKKENIFCINRAKDNTATNHSYDCYTEFKNLLCMINIKVQKDKGQNNAISAINILHRDYCSNPSQEKAYLIIKIHYTFNDSNSKNERVLSILGVDGYFLEEVNFSDGHKQDSRNWSKEFKAQSGRLLINDSFRNKNKCDITQISYQKTFDFIKQIAHSE
ncbi:hypothetical protein IQ300_000855 [Campylobacter upsaliensis]|nr:hypothetical protein [Campylobacter upsaliensis]